MHADGNGRGTLWVPQADKDLSVKLLELVQQASAYKVVRKGANEAVKAVHRSVAEIVILAADTEPIEIVLQLPLLCEDKGIPYVWVRSRQALGRAVGLSRPAIAVAIVGQEGSQLKNQINSMKDAVEQLLI